MIVSVNWLKKFTTIDATLADLVDLIGSRLVEIEEVIDIGAKYKDAVIVHVVTCEKLEGSDHLNVTKIDDGQVVEGVERDENGHIQVVCGAPNARAGMRAVWLPPKSTVPSSFDTNEPFVLDSRKLRGVMSHGMLASATELALYDDHTGILDIADDVPAGASFAQLYELDDHLLDIENKSLTHRPDCFGIIGFAREVAAIQGKGFTTPEWLRDLQPHSDGSYPLAPLKVTIDDADLSARYQAVVISDITPQASPLLVQTYLARVGMRPVNAVVDMTNYLMLLTGQPLHAFDYDKVRAIAGDDFTIHVRAGKPDEKLLLLDGREITLTAEDIVIAANDIPLALAGAMGGAATEIDETTTTIIIESATFNLFRLRTTQMRHGIFSEAITRFTKGQSPEQTAPVLMSAISLLEQWSHSRQASAVADMYPGKRDLPTITIPVSRINAVLGTHDATLPMQATLENVEFSVQVDVHEEGSDSLTVTPPYWRSDIHIPEDVIEEIGRINAYDDIEPSMPSRKFEAITVGSFDALKSRVRTRLVRAGANELLTYSFVHGDLLTAAGQNPQDSYRIINSISPDLQYYRQTITPSLLAQVHPNVKNGYESFGLFEINKVHRKSLELNDEDVPVEVSQLGFVYVDAKRTNGRAYYVAKKYVEYLLAEFGINARYEMLSADSASALTVPFEHRRSALIRDIASGQLLGVVGEYTRQSQKSFKLPGFAAGFEIDMEQLRMVAGKANSVAYKPQSRYPGTSRDICFKVGENVQYQQVSDAVEAAVAGASLDVSVEPIDIYQAEAATTKNITVRISMVAHDRTLTGNEANDLMNEVSSAVIATTDATIV